MVHKKPLIDGKRRSTALSPDLCRSVNEFSVRLGVNFEVAARLILRCGIEEICFLGAWDLPDREMFSLDVGDAGRRPTIFLPGDLFEQLDGFSARLDLNIDPTIRIVMRHGIQALRKSGGWEKPEEALARHKNA